MKGVSDKNAQNDKKIKGNKNDVKKPIQVLHISKKETKGVKKDTLDDNQSLSQELTKEIKAIKPQTTEATINEEKENYSKDLKLENKSYQELPKPVISQDEDQDFILERKVDK